MPIGSTGRIVALCYKRPYIYDKPYNEGLLKFCLRINFRGLLPGISSILIDKFIKKFSTYIIHLYLFM